MDSQHLVVVTATRPGDEINRICVTVNHFNAKRGVVMTAYPAIMSPMGTVVLLITNGQCAKVEDMARLNKARLKALDAELANQLQTRSGMAFDLVRKVCADQKLTLVDADPVRERLDTLVDDYHAQSQG